MFGVFYFRGNMKPEWITLAQFNEQETALADGLHEIATTSLTDTYFEPQIDSEAYLSEDPELGLSKTWFGKVNNQLFALMSHPNATLPMTVLAAESHLILADLVSLGSKFFSEIRWVSGNAFDATDSVFSKDDHGVTLEVFRAKSKDDAEKMGAFLNLKGMTTNFYVNTSDDLNQMWGIFEKFSEEKVGETHDRVSAEYFGIEYTKKHNIPTFIGKIEKVEK